MHIATRARQVLIEIVENAKRYRLLNLQLTLCHQIFLVDNILPSFPRQYHGHGQSTSSGMKMMKYTKQVNENSKIRLDSNLLDKILLSHGFKSSDNKIVNQISKQHGTFENV